MEEELEESKTEALAEDDPAEREEGVLMQDESESTKGTGHAKEATETEKMAEGDPIVLNPNYSDDSSPHILVKDQDYDRPAVSWEPPHNCRENSRRKYLLISDPRIRSSASTATCSFTRLDSV